jgi:hypothetical protein
MRTLILLAALAVPALADDPITIKLKLHAEPGKTTVDTSKHTDHGSTRIEGPDGKPLVETKPEGSETVERTTVLKADKDGKPTQFLRTFEKATDSKDGKTKAYSYQGRTILYERRPDGKFRLGVAGKGDLDPADAERLIERANRGSESEEIIKQFAPNKPVKVGDSWPLDLKPVARALEMTADAAKSTATVKLAGVETRGPTKFGTFDLDVRMSVTAAVGKIEVTFDPPAVFTMKGTIELAIDGSSTESRADMDMSIQGTGTWKNKVGGTGKITFDVTGKVEDRETAEQPAKETAPPTVAWLRAPGEWGEFKPKAGGFVAEFPGTPKEQTQKRPREETSLWTVEADGGAVAYVVSITTFAGADPGTINPKAVLDAVVQSQKGVTDVKEIKQDGHPGVEFKRADKAAGKDAEFRQRVVMVNGRMFQQLVVAEKGKMKADAADKFFKSFKITEKPKPRDD